MTAVVDVPTGLTKYVWRTNLMATKPYWEEWFSGLTKTFLSLNCKKILFLAGSERMDKDLSIAQMQGKFKLIVVTECGHVIQEDQPARVAEHIRETRVQLKIPVNKEEPTFVISASGKKIYIGR